MRFGLRWAALMLCCLAAGEGLCHAGSATEVEDHPPRAEKGPDPFERVLQLSGTSGNAGDFEQTSQQEYVAQLTRLQGLVERCRTKPESCNADEVGRDESVGQGSFKVHWDWLRDVIVEARDATNSSRNDLLQKAATRLAEDAKEATENGRDVGENTSAARKKVDQILSRTEFRRVSETSYFEQMMAALLPLIDRLFGRAASIVPHSPWLAPVLEWGLLGLAAVGLLLWAWRARQQQRVAIRLADRTNQAVWQKESEGWAERAQEEAARKEWREAVHCLYWSAIVMLEGQRLWRQNRARTPREYLILLEANSSKQTALEGLTSIFERIWYGLRPARETDYEQAKSLLDELKVA